MNGWQEFFAFGLLMVAAVEAYLARTAVNKMQKHLDLMHGHLLKLMRKAGASTLD